MPAPDSHQRISLLPYYFRAFLYLFFASVQAGAVIGLIVGLSKGQLTPALSTAIFGPPLALPAIAVGAIVVVHLLAKGLGGKRYLFFAGLLVGTVYAFLFTLRLSDIVGPVPQLLFAPGGGLAGLFAHRELSALADRLRRRSSDTPAGGVAISPGGDAHAPTIRWPGSAVVIICTVCASLYLLFPPSFSSNIRHAQIGSHELHIPGAYVEFLDKNSGMLRAKYPGGVPLTRAERNVRHRKPVTFIRIVFQDLKHIPAFNPEKVLQGKIDLFKASKVAGTQYGLIHQTQPDSIKNDWDELWIEREKGDLISFISCRKKYADGIVPHCKHHFSDSRFSYEVTFDKRLLAEWRTQRDSVLALMNSFQSEESARAFLTDQISKTTPSRTGETR